MKNLMRNYFLNFNEKESHGKKTQWVSRLIALLRQQCVTEEKILFIKSHKNQETT